jgi:hypothetical protein
MKISIRHLSSIIKEAVQSQVKLDKKSTEAKLEKIKADADTLMTTGWDHDVDAPHFRHQLEQLFRNGHQATVAKLIDNAITEMRFANIANDDLQNAISDNDEDGSEDRYINKLQKEFDKHRAKTFSILDRCQRLCK